MLDPGQTSSYDSATQSLICGVYEKRRRFHLHGLEQLVLALGAEAGFAVVQASRKANPTIAAWLPEGLSFGHTAVMRRCRQWLEGTEPIGFADGHGFGFGYRCTLSVRAAHRGAGASLWVLGRADHFTPRELRRARQLAAHLGYAGELALSERAPVEDVGSLSVPQPPAMTEQEVREILADLPEEIADCARWAARGYTNAQVAANLNVSEATVARRLNRAYEELGIAGRHELPIKALMALGRPEPVRDE